MDARNIACNLQYHCYERRSIDNGLSSIEFNDDNQEAKSIFNLIRTQLLGVLRDFDDIVKLRRQTLDDSEKQECLRVLMNLSHKSLIKAREAIQKLNYSKSGSLSVSDDFDHLCDYFNSLINIFSEIAPHQEVDLETLDIPAADLLHFDSVRPCDYSETHRRLMMAALINFIDPLVLQSQKAQDQNLYWSLFGYLNLHTIRVDEKTFRLYSSQLAELSVSLRAEVNLIHSDIAKVLNNQTLGEAASLKKFIQSLNILHLSPAQIFAAITSGSDAEYKKSIAMFMNKVFEKDSNIKLSDVIKSLLTLHALRMKHQSEIPTKVSIETIKTGTVKEVPIYAYEFEQAQETNSLIVNDRIPSTEIQSLKVILDEIKKYIDPKLNRASFTSLDTKSLSTNASIISTIDGLTKEFTQDGIAKNLGKQASAIYSLYHHKAYKVIFIKSEIGHERLEKLDQAKSNKELLSILDDIYSAALKYSAINLKNATELIYILGRSFDCNNKEKINPRTSLIDKLGNWFRSTTI